MLTEAYYEKTYVTSRRVISDDTYADMKSTKL